MQNWTTNTMFIFEVSAIKPVPIALAIFQPQGKSKLSLSVVELCVLEKMGMGVGRKRWKYFFALLSILNFLSVGLESSLGWNPVLKCSKYFAV